MDPGHTTTEESLVSQIAKLGTEKKVCQEAIDKLSLNLTKISTDLELSQEKSNTKTKLTGELTDLDKELTSLQGLQFRADEYKKAELELTESDLTLKGYIDQYNTKKTEVNELAARKLEIQQELGQVTDRRDELVQKRAFDQALADKYKTDLAVAEASVASSNEDVERLSTDASTLRSTIKALKDHNTAKKARASLESKLNDNNNKILTLFRTFKKEVTGLDVPPGDADVLDPSDPFKSHWLEESEHIISDAKKNLESLLKRKDDIEKNLVPKEKSGKPSPDYDEQQNQLKQLKDEIKEEQDLNKRFTDLKKKLANQSTLIRSEREDLERQIAVADQDLLIKINPIPELDSSEAIEAKLESLGQDLINTQTQLTNAVECQKKAPVAVETLQNDYKQTNEYLIEEEDKKIKAIQAELDSASANVDAAESSLLALNEPLEGVSPENPILLQCIKDIITKSKLKAKGTTVEDEVTDLQLKISTIQSEIEKNTPKSIEEITNIEIERSTVESNIASSKTKITDLDKEMDQLNKQLEELKSNKIKALTHKHFEVRDAVPEDDKMVYLELTGMLTSVAGASAEMATVAREAITCLRTGEVSVDAAKITLDQAHSIRNHAILESGKAKSYDKYGTFKSLYETINTTINTAKRLPDDATTLDKCFAVDTPEERKGMAAKFVDNISKMLSVGPLLDVNAEITAHLPQAVACHSVTFLVGKAKEHLAAASAFANYANGTAPFNRSLLVECSSNDDTASQQYTKFEELLKNLQPLIHDDLVSHQELLVAVQVGIDGDKNKELIERLRAAQKLAAAINRQQDAFWVDFIANGFAGEPNTLQEALSDGDGLHHPKDKVSTLQSICNLSRNAAVAKNRLASLGSSDAEYKTTEEDYNACADQLKGELCQLMKDSQIHAKPKMLVDTAQGLCDATSQLQALVEATKDCAKAKTVDQVVFDALAKQFGKAPAFATIAGHPLFTDGLVPVHATPEVAFTHYRNSPDFDTIAQPFEDRVDRKSLNNAVSYVTRIHYQLMGFACQELMSKPVLDRNLFMDSNTGEPKLPKDIIVDCNKGKMHLETRDSVFGPIYREALFATAMSSFVRYHLSIIDVAAELVTTDAPIEGGSSKARKHEKYSIDSSDTEHYESAVHLIRDVYALQSLHAYGSKSDFAAKYEFQVIKETDGIKSLRTLVFEGSDPSSGGDKPHSGGDKPHSGGDKPPSGGDKPSGGSTAPKSQLSGPVIAAIVGVAVIVVLAVGFVIFLNMRSKKAKKQCTIKD